ETFSVVWGCGRLLNRRRSAFPRSHAPRGNASRDAPRPGPGRRSTPLGRRAAERRRRPFPRGARERGAGGLVGIDGRGETDLEAGEDATVHALDEGGVLEPALGLDLDGALGLGAGGGRLELLQLVLELLAVVAALDAGAGGGVADDELIDPA